HHRQRTTPARDRNGGVPAHGDCDRMVAGRVVRLRLSTVGERIPRLHFECSGRLTFLSRRRALEDELRCEMEAHRAQMGDPRAFGNTLRLREEARDAWGWVWLPEMVHETIVVAPHLRH